MLVVMVCVIAVLGAGAAGAGVGTGVEAVVVVRVCVTAVLGVGTTAAVLTWILVANWDEAGFAAVADGIRAADFGMSSWPTVIPVVGS